ncbi:MAG: lipopolysaccharide biosynthesis [Cyanobacteria bacterium]|nr:lipopolysaccharide biosynthesis [Cyanobacteriota bacterium]
MANPIVKRYLLALRKYFWIIPIFPVLGMAGGGFVAIQPAPDPTFRTAGILSYRQQELSFSQTGAEIQQQGQALTKDLLLSDEVLEGVASGIRVKPEEILKKADLKFVVPDRKKEPTASPHIEVLYKDDNPRRALVATELLMTLMVEKSRQLNSARLQGLIEGIRDRLPLVTQELREAEQRLERYDRQEGAAILAVQNGSLVGAIAGSRQQQRQLQLQLEGINAQIQSLERRLGLTVDEAYVSSALSSDPLLGQLRGQLQLAESELAIQSKRLRAEHPTIKELQRQKETYDELLRDRAAEVISGGPAASFRDSARIRRESTLDPARQQLANSLVALRTQQETIAQQLALSRRSELELRQEYQTIPNKQLERDRLAQQVALKKAIYDRIQSKLVDSEAAEAETVSSLAIARPASLSEQMVPTSPRLVLMLLLGGAGGFVGSMVVLLVLGILDGRYQTASEIAKALADREVPVLGRLPDLTIEGQLPGVLPVLLEPSPYGDAYELFRSNIRRLNSKWQVLTIASLQPKEGKSVVAYNLAIASARAGKRTLLLEMNLRGKSEGRSVGVPVHPEAYDDPLKYYDSLSDCMRMVPAIENLYLVPSPGPQGNTAEILESSELKRLFDEARSRFDMVIVDSTALSLCNDTLLLEPLTDGLILVARPGLTESKRFTQKVDEMMDEETTTVRLLAAAIDGDSPAALMPEEEEEFDEEGLDGFEAEALDNYETARAPRDQGDRELVRAILDLEGDPGHANGNGHTNGNGHANGNGQGGKRRIPIGLRDR